MTLTELLDPGIWEQTEMLELISYLFADLGWYSRKFR